MKFFSKLYLKPKLKVDFEAKKELQNNLFFPFVLYISKLPAINEKRKKGSLISNYFKKK